MAGGDRIRLFCALQLPDDAVDVLAALAGGSTYRQAGSSRREHLHVTLAFLGARPLADVPRIAAELARRRGRRRACLPAAAALSRDARASGCSSATTSERPAPGSPTASGCGSSGSALYRREPRPWLPHVTVTRFRERPRLDPPLPLLDRIDAVRAALYSSTLRPGGAHYDVLETVALGGR